jgi:radical SAM peptide maturase (CXXX-repeat target family)
MESNYPVDQRYRLEKLVLTNHELVSVFKYEISHNINRPETLQEVHDVRKQLMGLVQEFVISDFKSRGWFNNPEDRISVQSCYSDYNHLHIRMYYKGNNESGLMDQFNVVGERHGDFKVYQSIAYNDSFSQAFPELFQGTEQEQLREKIFVHSFTFQTSEDCNLNCTYCYQLNKTAARMSFDVAKKCIDDMLSGRYEYINQHNSPALIMEFIGGEPLLEINLTRRIYEYFLDESYRLNHPWFRHHRVSICSNGLLYFDRDVQKFFHDYKERISFNISIDGNRDLHDSARIQPNKEGSYDVDTTAYGHYIETFHEFNPGSKMTLAPSNISHLFDSLVNFINLGFKVIHLNCVFEEGWTVEHARIYYEQLLKIADYIIENDLEKLNVAIFQRMKNSNRLDKRSDSNFCGGTGSMLALAPDGTYYPCIRYMPTSLTSDREALPIGDIYRGINTDPRDQEILDAMAKTTRRSQSNDICFDCPIGMGCAWCSGMNHNVYGTWNKRTMFICDMHKIEVLANVYYWNLLNIKHPEYKLGVHKNNVPDKWALEILSQDQLDFLKLLESRSIISDLDNGGNKS